MIFNGLHGWRRFLNRFRREDDAVVAIQVVIFSVMLLTSAGLVIDFGRAYSAHTQMQSFVDKAALAAANQLDGEADALTRATAAALAIQQSSTFTEESGDFSIATPLTFLMDDPVDASGNFSEAQLAALATTNPAYATHVHVEAQARTIKLTLISVSLNNDVNTKVRQDIIAANQIAVDLDGDMIPDGVTYDNEWAAALAENTDNGAVNVPSTISLTAFAVARIEVSFCGDISTMVMCNPFEGSGQSFASVMEGEEGARMLLRTDLQATGAPYPLSTDDGAIRVGLMKNPISEIGADAAGTCSDTGLALFQNAAFADNSEVGAISTDPWAYPATDEELERLRDTCLLASIDSQLQCLGGEALVKAAEPETITTAINTLFDIWDAPMDRVLGQAVAQGREFSPDYVASHGRITRAEYHDYIENVLIASDLEKLAEYQQRLADEIADKNRSSRIRSYTRTITSTQADIDTDLARRNDYPDDIANTASRRNLIDVSVGLAWGHMAYGDCLASDPSACAPYPYMQFQFSDTSGSSLESRWRIGEYTDATATEDEFGNIAETDVTSLGYYILNGNPGNDKEVGGSGENPNGTGSYENGGTRGNSDGFGVDKGVTGWIISNYTDQDLAGLATWENSNESQIIQVPAQSQVELQSEVLSDIVIHWNVNAELDNYTIRSAIDDELWYGGITEPSYDLLTGRLMSYTEYFATYYEPTVYNNGMDLDNPSSSFEWAIAGASTLYEGYSTVERVYSELLDDEASNGPHVASTDASGNTTGGGGGIGTLPDHYQFTSSDPSTEQFVERRLQNVAVVNCESMWSPQGYTGAALDAYSDTYVAELEGIASLFFTGPVVVEACDATVGTDPDGQMDCWNSDITAAYVPVEFQGFQAAGGDDDSPFLNYAVLVH